MKEANVSKALRSVCRRFRLGLRQRIISIGSARLLTVSLLLLVCILVTDWRAHIPAGWRLIPLALFFGLTGWLLLVTVIRPLKEKWDTRDILNYLDTLDESGHGMLLDLWELEQGGEIREKDRPEGEGLVQDALAQLADRLDQADEKAGFEKQSLKRWWKTAGIIALVCIVCAVPLYEYAGIGLYRFINPFSSMRWPHRTTISVRAPETGWKVAQDEPFTLDAEVTGEIPDTVVLTYRLEKADFPIRERLRIDNKGNVQHIFDEVSDPITFSLEGGDYETDKYTIEVSRRPRIEKIYADYTLPKYAGLPRKTGTSGDLKAVEGTKVKLDFTASMPLKKVLFKLFIKGEKPVVEELTLSAPTEFKKELMLTRNGRYVIELYSTDGFRESKPEEYDIRVTPDNPPEAAVMSPGQDTEGTSRIALNVRFSAHDDFGLKSVQFLYSWNGSDPKVLTDRITGPIRIKKRTCEAEFKWDLADMELGKKKGLLEYFVRAVDLNPTGRGVTESRRYMIKVLSPSEFQQTLLYEAKRIMTEALLAERQQREAYFAAKKWLTKGTGKEDDPLWFEMMQRQDGAVRAGSALSQRLKELITRYEYNRMSQELMSGRLAVIGKLISRVSSDLHPGIKDALGEARPKTSADAVPSALKPKRRKQLISVHDTPKGQKMAALVLQRVLRLLYDWRDLQTASLSAVQLYERQKEVTDMTDEIADTFMGKEIEDLTDESQKKLLTIGKQQMAVYEAESALETQLRTMWYKAEMEGRDTILKPLSWAFKNLRDKRVNDHLKKAAQYIGNNQPADIIKDQKTATRALFAVKAGLEETGRKTDPLPPISLAQKLVDPNPEKIVKTKTAGEETGTKTASIQMQDVLKKMKYADMEGEDPLSESIRDVRDIQEAVLSRTSYLASNRTQKEMPRFIRLKLELIRERQKRGLDVLSKTLTSAKPEDKKKLPPVWDRLDLLKTETAQCFDALKKDDTGKLTQQWEKDIIESLKDLLKYIARQRAVEVMQKEHHKQKGIDAFKRPYVLRDKNLDAVVAVISDMDSMLLCHRDAVRKLERFKKLVPASPPWQKEMEKSNHGTLAQRQKRADQLAALIQKKASSLQDEVEPRVAEILKAAGGPALYADAVSQAAQVKDTSAAIRKSIEDLENAVSALRDLMDARGEPPVSEEEKETEKEPAAEEIAEMTEEEYQKLNSNEALIQRLEANKALPEAIRKRLAKSLSSPVPEKYRKLVAAYVDACLQGK